MALSALAAATLTALLSALPLDARVAMLARMPTDSETVKLTTSDGVVRITVDTPLRRVELARLRAAVDRSPEDPEALWALLTELEESGDEAAARAVAGRLVAVRTAAVRRAPDDPQAAGCLAAAELKAGNMAGAQMAARRAVELAPAEPAYRSTLALTLRGTDRAGTVAALDEAVRLSPPGDVDVRLLRAWFRLQAAVKEARVGRDGAAGELVAAVREADGLLAEAGKRLKDANGNCGPDTRDRCLGLLVARDGARLLAKAAEGNPVEFVVFGADTVDLIRELVSPTSDDPFRLILAVFAELPAAPELAAPPAVRAATAPYLDRLAELSAAADPAAASTAAFLHGLANFMLGDPVAAEAGFREAVRLVPDFDLAWRGVVRAAEQRHDSAGRLAAARRWVEHVGSPSAWLKLADAHAAAGDWPAAERAVRSGLAKHSAQAKLLLAKMACLLRVSGRWTVDQWAEAAATLQAASPLVDQTPSSDLIDAYNRSAVLFLARTGELAKARQGAESYARTADDPADGRAVLALFPAAPAK